MKACIDSTVIADAADSDLITIEGNQYFPPSSLTAEAFSDSSTPYTCPWKGVCQYFDVGQDAQAGKEANWSQDNAWSYPDPKPSAIDTVKKDFTNYVAFWRDVTVSE